MDTFKIAIIEINKYHFNKDDYVDSFNHEHLKNEIKQYITFKDTQLPTLMDDIVETIGLTKEMVGNTSIVTEDDKHVYQLCHMSMKDNGQEDDEENINGLSSCITLGYMNVYGKAVLLCSKIDKNNQCVVESIDLDAIVDILYHKVSHKYLMVKATDKSSVIVNNTTVAEKNFFFGPYETIEDMDSYKCADCPFLKFNLLVLFKEDTTQPINKIITKLVGKQKIYGDCYVLSKSAENEYIDIDMILFKKIMHIAEGPLKNRELKDDEKDVDEEDNQLPIIMNRHCVLEKRFANYKPTCNYCKNEDTQVKEICAGCYRVRYHNKDCQLKDWQDHKLECLT